MLKQTLAIHIALIFLRLLSSVTGEEGFPGSSLPYDSSPFFISTLREMCLERVDPLSCQYWDTIRYKLSETELPTRFKTHQPIENNTEGVSQEEITIDIPIIDAENNLHKRFSVYRRRNPTARGYKRGPGFRSWGGKRDLIQDKKSKFVSWGGKRNEEVYPDDPIISDSEETAEKRQKFQNWGGKRSVDDFMGDDGKTGVSSMEKRDSIWKDRVYYLAEPFKKHVPKRPQFQSWGGKRAPYPWRDFFEYFRSQPRFHLNGGEKRKFSSWGGKRYDELENLYGNSHWEDKQTENSKRHVFQNWGGKRMSSDSNDSNALKETESSDNTQERSKREVKNNGLNEEPIVNSLEAETREEKRRKVDCNYSMSAAVSAAANKL